MYLHITAQNTHSQRYPIKKDTCMLMYSIVLYMQAMNQQEIKEYKMSKTVTLRMDEKVYNRFRGLAQHDNRPLSNFIETAAIRFVEEHEYIDEFEMAEIRDNQNLNNSMKHGLRDAKAMRGQFV